MIAYNFRKIPGYKRSNIEDPMKEFSFILTPVVDTQTYMTKLHRS